MSQSYGRDQSCLCVGFVYKIILLNDEGHKQQVEEYNEGMEKLKPELDKMNERLHKRANMIQEHQKDINIPKNDVVQKVKDLENKRDAPLKQIGEIDQEIVNATGKVKN